MSNFLKKTKRASEELMYDAIHAERSNHEIWVVCPVCGQEYDARMEVCCTMKAKDKHPVTLEPLDIE